MGLPRMCARSAALFTPRRHDAIHPGIRDELAEMLVGVIQREKSNEQFRYLGSEHRNLGKELCAGGGGQNCFREFDRTPGGGDRVSLGLIRG